MGELKGKLERLGLLHDSVVTGLAWKPTDKTLTFAVEDFYSNFEGLPEYPGAMGGSIILSKVQQVTIDIDYDEKHLFIYDFEVDDTHPDRYRISVSFRPSGRIVAVCGHIEFPELNIPTP